jgi:hypothetical protein
MISKTEPGAPAAVTNILLRVAAAIDLSGTLFILAATQLGGKAAPQAAIGLLLLLAAVPEFFLLLWTLRKLAIRLPSPALALNASIVMIGLPAVTLVTVSAMAMGAYTKSPVVMILTGVGGLIGLIVFRIWYIILLIWFNKSFS